MPGPGATAGKSEAKTNPEKIEEAKEKKTVATGPKPSGWAPLNVPIKRRRQTCAVLLWALLLPASIALTFMLLMWFPLTWWFAVPYFSYCLFDKTQKLGGRRSDWLRNLSIWKHFCDYFPMRLHKTVGWAGA